MTPDQPNQPAPATELTRYGIRWAAPNLPISTPMPDGYWTPWHIAQERIHADEERHKEKALFLQTQVWDLDARCSELRAELAASRLECDRLREALKAAMQHCDCSDYNGKGLTQCTEDRPCAGCYTFNMARAALGAKS